MKFELFWLIVWLIVAWVINDHTRFLDWSLGFVSGTFFASIFIRLASNNSKVRRWFNAR